MIGIFEVAKEGEKWVLRVYENLYNFFEPLRIETTTLGYTLHGVLIFFDDIRRVTLYDGRAVMTGEIEEIRYLTLKNRLYAKIELKGG